MTKKKLIEIRMGSDSDIEKIKEVFETLEDLSIPYQERILSAHRTPEKMTNEAKSLKENGYKVSIAAAGGSAHLQGMSASKTIIPIIAIPVYSETFKGEDAFYSNIQMPNEIPVGVTGIGMGKEAALNAAQIAYTNNPIIRNRIRNYRGLKELDNATNSESRVAIITPCNSLSNKITSMQNILDSLDIGTSCYTVKPTEEKIINMLIEEIEHEGYSTIIAPCLFNDEKSNNYFPQIISKKTDIPTIGIPFANGYAGSNDFAKNGVFEDMLYNTSAEGERTGSMVLAMGVNRGTNAAIYAAKICGLTHSSVQEKLTERLNRLKSEVKNKDKLIQQHGWRYFI